MLDRNQHRALTAAFLASGVLAVAAGVSPSASTPSTVAVQRYQLSASRWSRALGVCVRIELEGELVATRVEGSFWEHWQSAALTLRAPSMSVAFTRSCARTSARVVLTARVALVQRWTDSDGDVATRASGVEVATASAEFSQAGSGLPAHWTVHQRPATCVSYRATARISTVRASDTIRVGDGASTVCVTEQRSAGPRRRR